MPLVQAGIPYRAPGRDEKLDLDTEKEVFRNSDFFKFYLSVTVVRRVELLLIFRVVFNKLGYKRAVYHYLFMV
jgi:hypothetical protein